MFTACYWGGGLQDNGVCLSIQHVIGAGPFKITEYACLFSMQLGGGLQDKGVCFCFKHAIGAGAFKIKGVSACYWGDGLQEKGACLSVQHAIGAIGPSR